MIINIVYINNNLFKYQIFTGDGVNGHHEIRRFWCTTVEYRNRMYPDRPPLDSSGLGIMRNMDSNNAKETAITKLVRKRLMDTLAPRSGKTRLVRIKFFIKSQPVETYRISKTRFLNSLKSC